MFGMGTELSLKDFANVVIDAQRNNRWRYMSLSHYAVGGFGVAHFSISPAKLQRELFWLVVVQVGLPQMLCAISQKPILPFGFRHNHLYFIGSFLNSIADAVAGWKFCAIDFWGMVWDITKIVIIPIAAGLGFHYLVRGKFSGWIRVMPLVSMGGIALILTIMYCSRKR